ncbi:Mannose-1-phosphate guanyltransferase alpha [Vanrija pseudolonga]|uniref:mannose-1-phosphate guanylyltransferase n=1 Tax=Vanrija pseudolonga TaxID=143232 RepID=A0AAF0Y3M6_9TREE|nr:Mannose-1-phosphate guanyltransferase alpha [Vanrija pseudolonga]
MSVTKGVILVGGPSKGTRMRPLTLDCPKPLLPIAGKAMVWHPLAALAQVPGLTEVLLVGFYEDSVMAPFVREAQREFPNIKISYLPEYRSLGTAGGLYHFRDSILRAPVPQHIFICNIDIATSFPFAELLEVHNKHRGVGTIMGVPVKKEVATRYGSIVHDPETAQVLHYVEKPQGWISNTANGGVYLFDKALFDEIKDAMDEKTARAAEDPLVVLDENLQLEQDVIERLAAAKKLYVYESKDFWRQIKTAASAVTANSLYLQRFEKTHPDLLTKGPNITAPVYVHPTATIDPSAKVGPNVAIGPHVFLGEGARVVNAIILDNSTIDKHAVVVNAIVGSNSTLGQWARVDGEPEPETEVKGKISVSVLASDVQVLPETHVRSCIVLPNKSLSKNAANQVLL